MRKGVGGRREEDRRGDGGGRGDGGWEGGWEVGGEVGIQYSYAPTVGNSKPVLITYIPYLRKDCGV